MLSTTFLGHQGWLFQTKKAAVLVDPLLREDFGDTQALEYKVHPPRVITFDHFPALDAVVLSHEHDDHFDIPSLARIERTVPIHLSSRSSSAARTILQEMGFQVHPLVPGRKATFGDLELTPFCGDHLAVDCGDEWDTLPFFVRDTGGSGNFFSMVDIPMTEGHVTWAKSQASRPVVVGWTNNALDWSHMASYLAERVDATQDCFMKMGMGHKLISMQWGAPSAMLMCAGGFAFQGDKAWMNQRVFCVDTEAVCQMLGKLYRNEEFYATRPGQTFVMEGFKLKRTLDDTPFLTTAPRDTWPSRARRDVAPIPDYAPATGRRELREGERAQLEEGLNEFAASLVGGTIFKGLHSLVADAAGGRKITFAFVVRQESGPLAFEYAPSDCAFAPTTDDVRATCLAGLECWASDLLAVLRGELGPIALTFGRARLWNALPDRFRFDVFNDLYRMSHPLRRPAQTLAIYRREWAKVADMVPTVRHR